MADPTPTTGEPQGESTNVPTNDNGGNGAQDTNATEVELTKEQLEAAFKHPRFRQLAEKAKLADTLKKAQDEAQELALKEQGKWKEIAEAAEQKAKAFEQSTIAAEIKAFAAKFGAHDINDIAALADKEAVKFEDGVVTGAEDAVKALFESKPHLFNNQPNTTKVGSGTNPGDANNQGIPKYTLSELQSMSNEEYQKNKADIQKAIANGNVIDDRK